MTWNYLLCAPLSSEVAMENTILLQSRSLHLSLLYVPSLSLPSPHCPPPFRLAAWAKLHFGPRRRTGMRLFSTHKGIAKWQKGERWRMVRRRGRKGGQRERQ